MCLLLDVGSVLQDIDSLLHAVEFVLPDTVSLVLEVDSTLQGNGF